ncbi:MAG TPA: hypothetical protein VFR39_02040, partial [Burkholderiales bacterium]|nr:hypothetical protein [Burkholderiales bacterium]
MIKIQATHEKFSVFIAGQFFAPMMRVTAPERVAKMTGGLPEDERVGKHQLYSFLRAWAQKKRAGECRPFLLPRIARGLRHALTVAAAVTRTAASARGEQLVGDLLLIRRERRVKWLHGCQRFIQPRRSGSEHGLPALHTFDRRGPRVFL